MQNIDVVDSDGKSGLILSAINKKRKIMGYLVEQQCDVNLRDKEGKTALHYAADNDDRETMLFLLMNLADVSITDAQGKTAGSENPKVRMYLDDVALRITSDRRRTSLFRHLRTEPSPAT